MKNNRIIWGLISLIVLTTIAVSLGTISSYSQQDNSKKQDGKGQEDLSKYAVVDYNASESGNAVEREERILKNKRFDNQRHFVSKNPHPDTDGVELFDEIPPPPTIPTAESDLILIGEIVDASAHLSNSKENVYSEYVVRVKQILKENVSKNVAQGDSITADRIGGYVRYPNGQKVLYKVAQQDLPRVGSHYVLFLTTDEQSPNYGILTGYELKEGIILPLDTATPFRNLTGTSELNFIKAVRNKISNSLQPVIN